MHRAEAPPPPFATVRHPLAPQRIGRNLQGRPLHTNKFFSSLFLSDGSQPLYAHPYVLRARGPDSESLLSRLEVSYSAARRTMAEVAEDGRAEFYYHVFEVDVSLAAAEAASEWQVEDTDAAGIGVVVAFGGGRWRAPIVRGMPYVTGVFEDQTPIVKSAHALLSVNAQPLSVGAEFKGQCLRLQFSNDQVWRLYGLSQPTPVWVWDGQALRCTTTVSGAVRIALEPRGQTAAADILDRHCRSWAEGADVILAPPDCYRIDWRRGGDAAGPPILQCAELHHLDSGAEGSALQSTTALRFDSTTKGPLAAVAADCWELRVPPVEVGWLPEHAPDPALKDEIGGQLRADLACDVEQEARSKGSNYFAGKALYKFAQVILVADAMGEVELRDRGAQKLRAALASFAGREANPLAHDEVWGGVVGCGGLEGDPHHDFGSSFYNDHHYHWGYLIGAAAVARHFSPPCPTLERWVDALIRDVANARGDDPFFPTWRSFDWFSGHSWSQGLFESQDGKDQESVSEEMMFHYGAMLWGQAVGDVALAGRSRLTLSVAMRAAQRYFLMQPGGGVHPPAFEKNWVTGIFFENKVHHTTWFSPRLECIHGIQMLPVTPVSELLRCRPFVEAEWRELLGQALSETIDGWRSLLLLNLASLDPTAAYEGLRESPLDDGLSRSWALLWAATRHKSIPSAAPAAAAAAAAERLAPRDSEAAGRAGRRFSSALSLVDGPAGSKHLRVAVQPLDRKDVSLVAVHYSVNGGDQWNVDIHHPSPDGAWVHCGSQMVGAPRVAPGDTVSFWLYCIRRGLGEEERGLSWLAR